jgi:GABA(A) receptor-associated protein
MFSSSKPSRTSNISEFKEAHTLEERKKQSANILTKYPTSIPIFIDSTNMTKKIDKPKFVIPNGFTIGQLLVAIRMRTKLTSTTALFVFVNNHLMSVTTTITSVYEDYKDEDGFLYICCSEESTFG